VVVKLHQDYVPLYHAETVLSDCGSPSTMRPRQRMPLVRPSREGAAGGSLNETQHTLEVPIELDRIPGRFHNQNLSWMTYTNTRTLLGRQSTNTVGRDCPLACSGRGKARAWWFLVDHLLPNGSDPDCLSIAFEARAWCLVSTGCSGQMVDPTVYMGE
jgi:hypothetical protein